MWESLRRLWPFAAADTQTLDDVRREEEVEIEEHDKPDVKTYENSSGSYYVLTRDEADIVHANVVLRRHGHNRLKDPLQGGGGGALLTRGKNVIDTGGSGFGVQQKGTDETTQYGGGEGHFQIGRILVQRRFFRIYPMIGFGGTGIGLDSKVDTDTKHSMIKTSTGALLLLIGLGTDFTLRLFRIQIFLGLRTGYRWSLLQRKEDNSDSPNPTGFYFRAVAGFEFIRKHSR